MKKSIALFIGILAAASLLTGCVPKKGVNVVLNPDFVETDSTELDFDQIHNDTVDDIASIEEGAPFVFVTDLDIRGNNDNKTINVTVEVLSDSTEEDCKSFASVLLREIADAAYVQIPRYEMSSADDFGGVYRDYSVEVSFADESNGGFIYVLTVPAGEEIPLDPDYESYVEDWLNDREVYLENVVYDSNGNIISKD